MRVGKMDKTLLSGALARATQGRLWAPLFLFFSFLFYGGIVNPCRFSSDQGHKIREDQKGEDE
jgi:hypothetical protein